MHRLAGEDQVLEQRQLVHQHEFLVHHADAARERIGRRGEADLAIVEDDAAVIRTIDALQDPHQRRFSRAIAADDRVDRAGRGGKIDPVIGDDGAEAAHDRACADPGPGCGGGHGRSILCRLT